MMGCMCMDAPQPVGLVIQCTIVNPSSSSETVFNASWELSTSSQFMQCAYVRVIVQSIRWPESRVVYAEQLANVPPPASTSSSLAADAAVYVIPSCGGMAAGLLDCLDPSVFTLSNCFPFCMALHIASTVNQQQAVLEFRGYDSWTQGVLVTGRDCVPLSKV